jgi:hypothetical protein
MATGTQKTLAIRTSTPAALRTEKVHTNVSRTRTGIIRIGIRIELHRFRQSDRSPTSRQQSQYLIINYSHENDPLSGVSGARKGTEVLKESREGGKAERRTLMMRHIIAAMVQPTPAIFR